MFNGMEITTSTKILKNTIYCINLTSDENAFYFVTDCGDNVVIDFNKGLTINAKMLQVAENGNIYNIIFLQNNNVKDVVQTSCENNNYTIVCDGSTKIFLNNQLVGDKCLNSIKFKSVERFLDYDLIKFEGARNAVAIIKGKELQYFDYYDEFNNKDNQKIFMKTIPSMLRYGQVFKMQTKGVEKYLVYLDEFKSNIMEDFVVSVFLECVLVGDVNFYKKILSENLAKGANSIKSFFLDFDDFTCIHKDTAILYKKDTVVGIFKFEINNNFIENISEL